MLEGIVDKWKRLQEFGQSIDARLNAYLQTTKGKAVAAAMAGAGLLASSYFMIKDQTGPVLEPVRIQGPHYQSQQEHESLHYPVVSHTDNPQTTAEYRKFAFLLDNFGMTTDAHPPFVYDRTLLLNSVQIYETEDMIINSMVPTLQITLYNFNEACKEFPPEISKEYGLTFENGVPHDTIEVRYLLRQKPGTPKNFFDVGLTGLRGEYARAEIAYGSIRRNFLANYPAEYSNDLMNNLQTVSQLILLATPTPAPQEPEPTPEPTGVPI